MPVIKQSTYKSPLLCTNPHVQTIAPTIFRRVQGVAYERERISTPDDDFLDLDWSRVGRRSVAIVFHGLEGNSTRAYMRGMVKALNRRGWDAVAVNFRCCSGEPNKALRMYHSGDTEDIHRVVSFVSDLAKYEAIGLIGFSLGGNVILKYLGEKAHNLNPRVKAAVAISVPCDLSGCASRLEEPGNRLYVKRFLRLLYEKIAAKARQFPERVSVEDYASIKTLKEFDNRYTAPLHGFLDAEDYYRKSSSRPYLASISIPTLVINAADDPFLSRSCFPEAEAAASAHLFLEAPRRGGHCGFMSFWDNGEYWSERRAVSFLRDVVP
ncbi:MAG: YheT family hydrolase [Desulfomonilaceae bacterium]